MNEQAIEMLTQQRQRVAAERTQYEQHRAKLQQQADDYARYVHDANAKIVAADKAIAILQERAR